MEFSSECWVALTAWKPTEACWPSCSKMRTIGSASLTDVLSLITRDYEVKWILNKWLPWPSWTEINLVLSLSCMTQKLWTVFTFLKRKKKKKRQEKKEEKHAQKLHVACLKYTYCLELLKKSCKLWSRHHHYKQSCLMFPQFNRGAK